VYPQAHVPLASVAASILEIVSQIAQILIFLIKLAILQGAAAFNVYIHAVPALTKITVLLA